MAKLFLQAQIPGLLVVLSFSGALRRILIGCDVACLILGTRYSAIANRTSLILATFHYYSYKVAEAGRRKGI